MKVAADQIRVVLFDLGGVLVELSGVPTMMAWMENRVSREELFRMWLTSPAVRAFERGRITPEAFADQLIVEMALPTEREQLLQNFTRWTLGLFPGALEMIGRIPRCYTRATLSNTNALHWPLLMEEMQLGAVFDHHFASHLTGRIKPDDEAFQHVVETLKCRPQQILFLDDNTLNVEAANKLGLRAVGVKGVVEAEQALLEAGVLEP